MRRQARVATGSMIIGSMDRGPISRAGAFALGLLGAGVLVAASAGTTAIARAAAEKATAQVVGSDGKPLGTVDFEETLAGMLVTVRLKGLPPGPHGFHIHDIGRCEPPFASSGKILNPLNAKHGLRHEEGPAMGNMPNLYVPATGEITAEILNPFVTLAPDADGSLLRDTGTAVVLRTTADDHLTQPEGNSGPPIACGVIKKAP